MLRNSTQNILRPTDMVILNKKKEETPKKLNKNTETRAMLAQLQLNAYALAAVDCAKALHCVCWSPQADTVRSPLLPDAFAAFAHLLCCTSHERTRAFCRLLKAELPSTWNWPLPSAVTAGGVTPPRAPVNFWMLPDVEVEVEVEAAVVEAAAAAEEEVVEAATATTAWIIIIVSVSTHYFGAARTTYRCRNSIARRASRTRSSDNIALVVNGCHSCEVRLNAKDGVERIGLTTGLRSDSISSRLRRCARVLGGLVGTARVHKGVADELRDDIDVLSRAVVEGSLVDGLEAGLLAVVEANAELNLRDSAFTEVTDGRRRASRSSRGCGRRGGRVDCSSCNCDLCKKNIKLHQETKTRYKETYSSC